MITQLFERGDYTTFDLLDTDRFNDISSVTSVLKNYFRSLPNPLLTYQLYEKFVQAISIKDIALKNRVLSDLVKQLPSEHLCTLRVLMIHLNRCAILLLLDDVLTNTSFQYPRTKREELDEFTELGCCVRTSVLLLATYLLVLIKPTI